MVKFFHHTKNQDSVTPLTPKKGSPKKNTFFDFFFFLKLITFEPIKLGVCNLISLKLGSSSFTIPKNEDSVIPQTPKKRSPKNSIFSDFFCIFEPL